MLFRAPYDTRQQIMVALAIRYEQAGHFTELQQEIPWLDEVRTLIVAEAATKPPIMKEALTRMMHYLDEAIKHIEPYRPEPPPE